MFMSRFITSQSLADSFNRKLQQYQKVHPTAEDQQKQECCRSGVCCWRRPGSLVTEDVTPIAQYLGLSEQELFKQYLVVDRINGNTLLLPRREHQTELAGEMVPWEETYSIESPCVFFDQATAACKIHDVKPKSCREYKCWEDTHPQVAEFPEGKLKELGWSGYDPDD